MLESSQKIKDMLLNWLGCVSYRPAKLALMQKTPDEKEKKDHAKRLKQQANQLAALETELAILEKRSALA